MFKKLCLTCQPPFYKCNEKSDAASFLFEKTVNILLTLYKNKRNRAGVGMLLLMNATLSLSCSFRGAVAKLEKHQAVNLKDSGSIPLCPLYQETQRRPKLNGRNKNN